MCRVIFILYAALNFEIVRAPWELKVGADRPVSFDRLSRMVIIAAGAWPECVVGIDLIHLPTAHGNGLYTALRSLSLLTCILLFLTLLQRLHSLRIQL